MRKGLIYLIHLLASTVIFVVLCNVLPLRYEANDDIAMCQIANGSYTGTPDCHLVFINALYGKLVAWLYSISHAVEWYTLLLCILHVVSFSALSYSLQVELRHIRKDERLIITIGLLQYIIMVIVWAQIILAFQFTTTAGLTCMAGCVLLTNGGRIRTSAGVSLVLIASMLRFKVALLMGTLMGLPILMGLMMEMRHEPSDISWYRSIIAKRLCVCAVTLVGVLALHYIDGMFYRAPEWKEYMYYNTLRGHINDNPNAVLATNHLPESITKVDFLLLRYFAPDPEIMTTEVLEDITDVVDEKKREKLTQRLSRMPDRIDKHMAHIAVITLLYLLTIIFNAMQLSKSDNGSTKRLAMIRIVGLTMQWVLFASLCGWVAINGTLKTRVFICMLTPMIYMLWKNFMAERPDSKPFRIIYASYIALYVAAIWVCAEHTYRYKQNEQRLTNLWRNWQLEVLKQIPEGVNICTLNMALRVENLNPWHIKDFDYNMLAMGWRTNNPGQKGILESHRDLLRDNVYMFLYKDEPLVGYIRYALKRHYDISTRTESIASNRLYEVLQIREKK